MKKFHGTIFINTRDVVISGALTLLGIFLQVSPKKFHRTDNLKLVKMCGSKNAILTRICRCDAQTTKWVKDFWDFETKIVTNFAPDVQACPPPLLWTPKETYFPVGVNKLQLQSADEAISEIDFYQESVILSNCWGTPNKVSNVR